MSQCQTHSKLGPNTNHSLNTQYQPIQSVKQAQTSELDKQTNFAHFIFAFVSRSAVANILLVLLVTFALAAIVCSVDYEDNTLKETEENPDTLKMANIEIRCGGTGASREPDQRTHDITAKMQSVLEGKTGKKYGTFKAVKTTTQVVAGTNHFIKVLVDEGKGEYVHLRVYEKLDSSLELSGFQESKTAAEEIEYFQ